MPTKVHLKAVFLKDGVQGMYLKAIRFSEFVNVEVLFKIEALGMAHAGCGHDNLRVKLL